jgi:hypothetical protein
MKTTPRLGRPRLLIVGSGDVGRRAVALLRGRFRLFAMTRDAARVAPWRALQAVGVRADLDARRSLERVAALAPYVLHLAPPPGEGEDDGRTRRLLAALGAARARRRRRMARSRTGGSAIGIGTRARLRSARVPYIVPERRFAPAGIGPRLVYASTTGVYGDCGGAWVRETRPVAPANPRARRRVAAERRLREAGRRGTVSPRILRIPGIYAGDRLPLARLAAGTAALRDEDDVYTNHIHADDLAAILVRTLLRGRPQRIVHAVDATQLKMGAYFDRVADAYGMPRPPRITREQAERSLAPTLLSFMRESRRLDNTRLARELRVRLRYPEVAAFLREHAPVK